MNSTFLSSLDPGELDSDLFTPPKPPGRKFGMLGEACLCPLGAPSRLKEFQQIVRGTDELPFRLHFRQSAQQKSAEPAPLFDLSENRFHDGLAQLINGPSGGRAEFMPHLLGHPGPRGRRPRGEGHFLTVFLPIRRHVQINALPARGSVTFASLKYPLSAVACSGLLPVITSTSSSIGTNCCLSLASCVTAAATITCAWLSTAACAL